MRTASAGRVAAIGASTLLHEPIGPAVLRVACRANTAVATLDRDRRVIAANESFLTIAVEHVWLGCANRFRGVCAVSVPRTGECSRGRAARKIDPRHQRPRFAAV